MKTTRPSMKPLGSCCMAKQKKISKISHAEAKSLAEALYRSGAAPVLMMELTALIGEHEAGILILEIDALRGQAKQGAFAGRGGDVLWKQSFDRIVRTIQFGS